MASTTVPDFLDALKVQLEARAGLADVTIATCALGPDIRESIEFEEIESSQSWASIGQRKRQDAYTVRGSIWSVKDGADEEVAKEARDAAFYRFGELEQQLRTDPFVNNSIPGDMGAQIQGFTFNQWPDDRRRIAVLRFEISVKARI